MKKVKNYVIAFSTAVSLLFFANSASAHVTVNPAVSSTAAWETYTMKVPVEKDIPTTKVALKMPAGVEFQQYQEVPGWNTKIDKNAKETTVTWSATGEGIKPGQFQQFVFVAKNPDKASKVEWNAYQYYKDGSIVEWTGDENSDSPHSITDIAKSTGDEHSHGGATMDSHGQMKKESTDSEDHNSDNESKLPLTLSIIGLVVAIVALIMASRRRK